MQSAFNRLSGGQSSSSDCTCASSKVSADEIDAEVAGKWDVMGWMLEQMGGCKLDLGFCGLAEYHVAALSKSDMLRIQSLNCCGLGPDGFWQWAALFAACSRWMLEEMR